MEELLFFKKEKILQTGLWETCWLFCLVHYHCGKMNWKVSHTLLGTTAIPWPPLQKQQCNLGELHKTSGWEDMRRAGVSFSPSSEGEMYTFCIVSKSNIFKVWFYKKLRKSDHWLKSRSLRTWFLQVTCLLHIYKEVYCEGSQRFLNAWKH